MARSFCNYNSSWFHEQPGKNKAGEIVDWNDPANYAWKNFDWDVLGTTQKEYIISLWKKYGGNTTPPNLKNRKTDNARRFKFFDLMNLAPTNNEANGHHGPNPTPLADLNYFELDGSPFWNKRIRYNANLGGDSANRFVLQNWINDGAKPTALHSIDGVTYPAEDVFKLMWMLNLVSEGHEKQMGPFSLKLKDGNPIKSTAVDSEIGGGNPIQLFKVDINQASLDRFITYSQNNYTFVKSIILDYLEYYKDPNAIHIDPNEPRPDPVECEKLIAANKGGSMAGKTKQFVMSRFVAQCTSPGINISTGPAKNLNFFRSLPLTLYPEDTFYRDGTLPSLKTGTNNVISGWVALDAVTFVPWTFVWKFIAREGFWEKETFDKWKKDTGWPPQGATPEPPELPYYVYDDTKSINDNRNDLKNFPYKSVAQVFDEKTNYKFSIFVPYARTDTAKMRQVGNGDYSSYVNIDWIYKDARARLWMYRYGVLSSDTYGLLGSEWNDKLIPERELIYLIRLSHGISRHSAPLRSPTKFINPSSDEIKVKIISKDNIQLGPTEIIDIDGPNNSFSDEWKRHLQNEINFIRECGGIIANKNIKDLNSDNYGYTATIPITYRIGTFADRGYVYVSPKRTTIEFKIDPYNVTPQKNKAGIDVTGVPKLRNHYSCVLHDLYGFPRYSNTLQIYPSDVPPTPLTGDRFYPGQAPGGFTQVVNHETNTGCYSFNGGNTDRDPIIPDYDWLDSAIDWLPFSDNFVDEPKGFRSISLWKKTARVDVRNNHLSLWTLINPPTSTTSDLLLDPSDRFVTPEQVISTTVNSKTDFSVNEDSHFYHSHSTNYQYSPSENFIFGLLTKKELQFLYELVSQTFYGGTETTLEGKQYVSIWQPELMNGDRWAEIRTKVNMSVRKPRSNIGSTSDNMQVKNLHSFFKDYILWAAPTYEQFYKKDFSTLLDNSGTKLETFVSLYKEIIDGNNPKFPNIDRFRQESIDAVNQSKPNGYSYWNHPCIFPFHGLAKEIIQSEASARPLVPAWVHMNSISRLNNKSVKKMGDSFFNDTSLLDWNSINDFEENYSESSNFSRLNRVLGGNLIALPRFVLGGRRDLGENEDSWDKNWGECPFYYTKDKQLIVGSLDDVLDNWAKQNKFKGKYYVSAMEILFWIRYRHGIAAAPSNQRIDMSAVSGLEMYDSETDIKTDNIWPLAVGIGGGKTTPFRTSDNQYSINFANQDIGTIGFTRRINFYDGQELTETKFLNTETLNNVSMLTSYYTPIFANTFGGADTTESYSEEYNKSVKYANADALMELTTRGKNGPFTGWNSEYVAYWPGQKNNVKINIESSFIDELTSFVDAFKDEPWFNKTKINLSSVIPYQYAHRRYRSSTIKNNETISGFSGKSAIKTTDIQAAFRAYKLLRVDADYSDFVSTGLTRRQGERDSVVMTLGNFVPDPIEKPNEFRQTVFFISGDNNEDRGIEGDESYNYRDMKTRPWRSVFKDDDQQHINSRWLSDWSLGGGCEPEKYVYMRHIIKPFTLPYNNHFNVKNQYGWYSTEQLKSTYNFYGGMWEFHTVYGLFGGAFSPENLQFGGSILSSKKSTELITNRIDGKQRKGGKRNGLKEIAKLLYMSNQLIENITDVNSLVSELTGLNENVVKLISSNARLIFWTNGVFSKYGSFAKNLTEWNLFNWIARLTKFVDEFKGQVWDPVWPVIQGIAKALAVDPNNPNADYERVFALGPGVLTKYAIAELNKRFLAGTFKKFIETAVKDIERQYLLGIISQATRNELIASTAAFGSIGSLGIALLVYFVTLEIEACLKGYLAQRKLESYWKFIDDATKNNWIEGPYLESQGRIRIPKAEVTEILTNYVQKKDDNGRIVYERETATKNNGTILFNTNPPKPETDEKKYTEWVAEQNKIFYDTYLDNNILPRIKPGGCECELIMDLIIDTPQGGSNYNSIKAKYNSLKSSEYGNPNSRKSPEKGIFRRAWKSLSGGARHKILDDAPIWSDMPIIKKVSSVPLPVTAGAIFFGDTPEQISDFQTAARWTVPFVEGSIDKNYRINGSEAFYVLNAQCPRFWWPLISNVDGDFCDYVARNGRYPKRSPEVYSPCDGSNDTPQSITTKGPRPPYGAQKLLENVRKDYNQNPGAWKDHEEAVTNFRRNIDVLSRQDSQLVRYSRSIFASGNPQVRGRANDWPSRLNSAIPGGNIVYMNTNNIIGPSWDGVSYLSYFTDYGPGSDRNTPNIDDTFAINNYRVEIAGGVNSSQNTSPEIFTKYWGGNGVVAMQGVFGIPVPHERELVRLFRKKFGIDMLEDSLTTNCCDLGKVLPVDASYTNNMGIDTANNCKYVIKLNNVKFFNKMITRCLSNTNEKKDNNPSIQNHSNLIPESMDDLDGKIVIGELRKKHEKNPNPTPPGGWPDTITKKEEFYGPCIGIPPEQCKASVLPGTQTDNEIIPKEKEREPNPATEHLTLALANEVSSHLRGSIQTAIHGIASALSEWKVGSRRLVKVTRRRGLGSTPLEPGENVDESYWVESDIDGKINYSQLPKIKNSKGIIIETGSPEYYWEVTSEYTEDIYQNIFGQRYGKNGKGTRPRNFGDNVLKSIWKYG